MIYLLFREVLFYYVCCSDFVPVSLIFLQGGFCMIFNPHNYHSLSHTFYSFHPFTLNSWGNLQVFSSISLIYYFKELIFILNATDGILILWLCFTLVGIILYSPYLFTANCHFKISLCFLFMTFYFHFVETISIAFCWTYMFLNFVFLVLFMF